VSVFAQKTKQVLAQGKVGNKTNEIPLVAQLAKQLGLSGLVLTADALHAQKQTVKAIIESGNDYVIGVKGNQQKLYSGLKKTPEASSLSAAT
jgi:predicted transposase YbfD/YdcC